MVQNAKSLKMSCYGLNQNFLFTVVTNEYVASEENLRAALGKMGIGGRTLEDVMDKVRNRHYQVKSIRI